MKAARIGALLWSCFVLLFYMWSGSPAALAVLAGTGCALAAGALLTFTCGKRCAAALSMSEEAEKGRSVLIELTVKNTSFLPVCRCEIQLSCRNILTGEQVEIPASFSLWPKGAASIRAEIAAPYCGCLSCRIGEAAVWDLFSIYRARRRLQAEASTYVMPQLQEAEISPEELDAYNMESYRYSASKKGNDPGDTFGIREYEEGDSPKTIHWKLTGKMGELMVRELGLPVENSIMLLLEKGMEPGAPLTPQQRDKAAELFLSLSHTLLSHQIAHSAGWQDYRTGRFISRRIEDKEALWAMIGLLLETPYEEDPVPAQIHCLEYDREARFSHYLYVTAAGSRRSMSGLENYGAVTVYQA